MYVCMYVHGYRSGGDLNFKGPKSDIFFGQNAVNDSQIGMIAVGDPVVLYDHKK